MIKHQTQRGYIGKINPNYRHGAVGTRAYSVWRSMRGRCGNPNSDDYKNYGGRGIKVCKSWRHFPAFLLDMGEPPKGFTIERVNNNRGYYPGNCRWIPRGWQNRNRRNNLKITFFGQTKYLAEWARALKLDYSRLHKRIKYLGWPVERAFGGVKNEPV